MHDSFELWLWTIVAIVFKDRKNYWNYCKLFQCRGGNGNRSKLKDCLAKRNEVHLQTTRLYYACGLVFISRFIFVRILFFFFFSPLSWCLSNYFCAIVMKWLYNEFFFYVEIVVLYNDLIKLWYIEESLLCHELKFKEIFEEPFMWFFK